MLYGDVELLQHLLPRFSSDPIVVTLPESSAHFLVLQSLSVQIKPGQLEIRRRGAGGQNSSRRRHWGNYGVLWAPETTGTILEAISVKQHFCVHRGLSYFFLIKLLAMTFHHNQIQAIVRKLKPEVPVLDFFWKCYCKCVPLSPRGLITLAIGTGDLGCESLQERPVCVLVLPFASVKGTFPESASCSLVLCIAANFSHLNLGWVVSVKPFSQMEVLRLLMPTTSF